MNWAKDMIQVRHIPSLGFSLAMCHAAVCDAKLFLGKFVVGLCWTGLKGFPLLLRLEAIASRFGGHRSFPLLFPVFFCNSLPLQGHGMMLVGPTGGGKTCCYRSHGSEIQTLPPSVL